MKPLLENLRREVVEVGFQVLDQQDKFFVYYPISDLMNLLYTQLHQCVRSNSLEGSHLIQFFVLGIYQ